jgi:hypothetical protein
MQRKGEAMSNAETKNSDAVKDDAKVVIDDIKVMTEDLLKTVFSGFGDVSEALPRRLFCGLTAGEQVAAVLYQVSLG